MTERRIVTARTLKRNLKSGAWTLLEAGEYPLVIIHRPAVKTIGAHDIWARIVTPEQYKAAALRPIYCPPLPR